jgi:predicted helicase
VGFTKEEIIQRLRIFTGRLPDEIVAQSLNLKNTGTWKLAEARQKIKAQKPEANIYHYAYRPFDNRWVCYESLLLDRARRNVMQNMLNRENLGLNVTRRLRDPIWQHVFVTTLVTDKTLVSSKDNCYFFPLYLYNDEPVGAIRELPLRNKSQLHRITNFTPEFLETIKTSLGSEPTPEEIFFYIYAVLYSPTYRKRYEEFLKIDFPRIPLLSNYDVFKELSNLGKELVDLHLLKHPELEKTEVGFPKAGSNKVDKIKVVGTDYNLSIYINKEQYFEGIPREVWEYRIGAYQVMEKYLKDRKGRKLSLDKINHYMKVSKAIQLTIELQEKIDDIPFFLPQRD